MISSHIDNDNNKFRSNLGIHTTNSFYQFMYFFHVFIRYKLMYKPDSVSSIDIIYIIVINFRKVFHENLMRVY